MSESQPLVILKTGTTHDAIKAEAGDFEDWTVAGIDRPDMGIVVVQTSEAERLPRPETVGGVVIAASHDMVTDRPARFFAAEIIRENVFELTQQEVPYSTAVTIQQWAEDPKRNRTNIFATIHVERDSQKRIVVGAKGSMIKEIGTLARHDIEEFLARPVYLKLNVRHEPGWRENQRLLAELEGQAASWGQ